jgi:hypothetical protein
LFVAIRLNDGSIPILLASSECKLPETASQLTQSSLKGCDTHTYITSSHLQILFLHFCV